MKQRMNPIVLTAILAISAFVVFTASVASAETIYVPEGGNQTIQAAVNNATDGDIITVHDGKYDENVDVNTGNLTIQSENGSANCIVNAASSNVPVFKVTANYVNITGFTVTGASDMAGIYLGSGVDHCTISENNASNNKYGIYLYSLSNNNNSLTSNTANSNNWYGIYINYASNNNLTSNTANSNNWYGIYINYASNNNLTNNTASNNKYGIRLNTANNNNLTSNTANSNTQYGICLESSSNNNVSCNWVQNNSLNGFRLNGGSTGNTIEHNNIIANVAYQFYNDQTNDVEAKHNYWGAGMNNDTINTNIYDGQDDQGKGNVTFYEYETGPVPCAPIPELSTIALLAVGLLMLAGYVRIGRKKDK